jgi:hypothetical protein
MPEAFSMNSTLESVNRGAGAGGDLVCVFLVFECGVGVKGDHQLLIGNDFGRRKNACAADGDAVHSKRAFVRGLVRHLGCRADYAPGFGGTAQSPPLQAKGKPVHERR